MKPFVKCIISIAIPLTVGGVSGFFTTEGVTTWFTTINKPSFNPPNWLFAPVWTALYIMMGIAFFLIWKSNAAATLKNIALRIYFIQLAFNFLWSFLFFYMHQPGWALVDILLLWVSIILTMFAFKKVSVTAPWLLLPYICWVSFATLLNYSIWRLN
jgi:benzodiazapine receptor